MSTSKLIWSEWIDNLALRRVFFLEHDHFLESRKELRYLASLSDPELEFQSKRPPFIPHPEIRDTIPSVALYSALYKLPDYFFSTASSPSTSLLDRQLASTVDFFDKCVPNQPGYSSSVAAVTILPDASQVAQAWRKWYQCASRLRRLRFIRNRIRELEKNMPPTDKELEEQVIDFQKPIGLFESPHVPNVTAKEGPIMLPSPPHRHRKDSTTLPTVEEMDYSTWDPSPTGLLPRLEMEDDGASQPSVDVESGIIDGGVNSDNDALPSQEIRTASILEPNQSLSLSFDTNTNEPQNTRQGGKEFADNTRAHTPSPEHFIPVIDTRRSPSTDTYDTRETRFHYSSTELRKSPESMGLAEEGKLDSFMSEDGMEQV